MQVAWTRTPDALSRVVEGAVRWSRSLQRGVMRIIGLAPNDRRRWTYQLWIFDETPNQKSPVDGGVFDLPPGQGDLLVPVRARLPVGKAVLFAVTVEQPGCRAPARRKETDGRLDAYGSLMALVCRDKAAHFAHDMSFL